jgi:hypothetical protein
MAALNVFCTQLVNFFEELSVTIPEERDIKKALEMIKMAKNANPRLVADIFYNDIYLDFYEIIMARDINSMMEKGRKKIENSYNEISPALMIFDKYWGSLSSVNQNAIWSYLEVLCKLVAKTR